MRACLTLGLVGLIVMIVALAYGFAFGGGWDEVQQIAALPWGLVTFIDVYVGFALFCGWIIFRENHVGRATVWVVLVMTLGNLLACVYLLWVLKNNWGNWQTFWMGTRFVTVD